MNQPSNISEAALSQIRDWLKAGLTISATDPNGRVLEMLNDGTMNGGLTIVVPSTPSTSEAARRAAERILTPHSVEVPTFADADEEHAWRVEQVAKVVQSALDSTHPAPCKECGGVNPWCELEDRITNYFGNGGLFNPEMMEHQKVSQLLMDVLDAIRNSGVARANPAPKEGETPKTDAVLGPVGRIIHTDVKLVAHARSLELRLAEKTRRLQQAEELLKKAEAMMEDDFPNSASCITTFLNSKTP